VKAGLTPATDAAAMALNVKAGALLFHTIRLRIVDGNVLGCLEAFVGAGIPVTADEASLTSGSSHAYLGSTWLEDATAERLIDAVAASGDIAQHLGVLEGSALLRVRRTTFSKDGQPIEYLIAQYRGDRFEYTIPSSRIETT